MKQISEETISILRNLFIKKRIGGKHTEQKNCLRWIKNLPRDKKNEVMECMKKETKMEYGEFCKIFGKTPRNKILEFLLALRNLDYTIGDIAKETGLNRATTYNTMEELIKQGIIKPTRKVSGGQLYAMNIEKKEVKALIETFNKVLKKILIEHKKC